MKKLFRLSSLGILLASPAVPVAMQAAVAQSQPAAEVAVAPLPAAVWTRESAHAPLSYIQGVGPEGLTPGAPPPAAGVAVAPLPAAVWTRESAQALLSYIEGVGAEGLSPAAYAPDRL